MVVQREQMPGAALAGSFSNRLAGETSPYLLQHAHNPVDWFAWGDEPFARARREDKPIFLSIGYSACHWCHVMERESFENESIARILNENFISIKVDREQRPDVDDVYMQAVQMMTGSGGWPLSVFLTPDGKPFYGGTYFPPYDMMGRPGFERILFAVKDAWQNRRKELLSSADRMTELLGERAGGPEQSHLNPETLARAREHLERMFDPEYGGFGTAPKFPQPSTLLFLLRHYNRTADKTSLEMVEKTLDAMAAGGIHDHLGGGFHRYSTDRTWLVPHFEKMLYDQALLSRAYVEAWQITGKHCYAETARDVFDYVLRQMTDPQGAFYSAEDADSQGSEGTFYLWQPDEVTHLLGGEAAELFNARYGVTNQGNFEHGRSILSVVRSEQRLADLFHKQPAEVQRILADARQKLLARRAKRPRPHLDDKVITGWNGLMIWAMAYGGRALDEHAYVNSAAGAADFILAKVRVDGRLHRYYRSGRAVEPGFLDDYAFMVLGLLELYEATFEAGWLAEAKNLAGDMIKLFHDSENGGFFLTGSDQGELIERRKPAYDGAIPSGNSIATLALLRLGHITRDDRLRKTAENALAFHSSQINSSPASLTAMLIAADLHLGPTREIVIVGDKDKEDTKQMVRAAHSRFLPRTVAILYESGEAGEALEALIPEVHGNFQIDERATAYVCESFTCRAPVNKIDDLEKSLSNSRY